LKDRHSDKKGFAVTVCGIDQVDETNFRHLVEKTEPLTKKLNCNRLTIKTNARRRPNSYTHGLTLASCLFLLSDLFEQGTLAADWTHEADFVVHPWGNNHLTNKYFSGSDYIVNTIGAEVGRTQKIASIVEAGIGLELLSFCRRTNVIPANCGRCTKCIRTKAMITVVLGTIPDIFLDNSFNEQLIRGLLHRRNELVELFDLFLYAKEHDYLSRLPSLERIIEEARIRPVSTPSRIWPLGRGYYAAIKSAMGLQ
jgi:hypothetical protein